MVFDLTVVMGGVIAILLHILYLSVQREHGNLKQALGYAQAAGQLPLAYRYLSSHLLLRRRKNLRLRLMQFTSVPQLALLVPVLALSWATVEDFMTRDRVVAISPPMADARLFVMILLLLLVWVSAVMTYLENIQIARLWMNLDRRFAADVDDEFAAVEEELRKPDSVV